jgi:cytochrome c oxidase accessory protein FixG
LKKSKQGEAQTALLQQATAGDCIDCGLCVQVCPTAIDIRNGTQLECINCTACIDACDAVMEKIDRPLGLIRYDSESGIATGKKWRFTTRMKAYTAVLIVLIGFEVFLLTYRDSIETLILRTPGRLYQEVDENYYSNLYNFQIINKTNKPFNKVEFRLVDRKGRIELIGENPDLPAGDKTAGSLFIILEKSELEGHKNRVEVEIIVDNEVVNKVKTNFLGPM